jgi:hypothetical protein
MLLMATWRCLMLPGAKDCDLLRSKPLFATEFICLAVLSGKAQQIEFTVFVHLKLSKSLGRPVPGSPNETYLWPLGEMPIRKQGIPQLQPMPFFVRLQRNGPAR